MPLAARQQEDQWHASAFGAQMNLGAEATPRASERFPFLPVPGADDVLVGADERAVRVVHPLVELAAKLGVALQRFKNPPPNVELRWRFRSVAGVMVDHEASTFPYMGGSVPPDEAGKDNRSRAVALLSAAMRAPAAD